LKNLITRVKLALTGALFFVFDAAKALAENETGNTAGNTGMIKVGAGLEQSVTADVLANKIIAIAGAIGGLAGAICIAMLVYAGIRLTTATNEKTRAEAKDHIKHALIGVAIVALALLVVAFIVTILKE
jgi:predicted permease